MGAGGGGFCLTRGVVDWGAVRSMGSCGLERRTTFCGFGYVEWMTFSDFHSLLPQCSRYVSRRCASKSR